MLKVSRYELIFEVIKEKKNIKIEELIERLNVSEATIRRDLTFLEKAGKIRRVHGGAILVDTQEESLIYKKEIYSEEKEKIGKFAASLVESGNTIYLDAGTSVFAMIKYLSGIENIKVVTNGVSHIDELNNKRIETYLIGGKIKTLTGALVGGTAAMSVKNFNFDLAFMGANAIDINGYSTPDSEEALIKNEAASKANKTYFLCDESKLKKKSFINFYNLEDSYLITNAKEIDNNIKDKLKGLFIVNQ
ncbi:DeoR/GlpR family DNA-binding transcription regulator [Brachyspira hampsonii]|uniref:Transcription-repair coupling factor n=1 Tax=Brachyspira hampsonii TaxID=1287055 RepID=A0AAC9XJD2_9SPIR|nr:DeoR/GlpR family DNA-binding transcription regulator [Brachyspira hampsonii]ASJ20667.1 transcription-repair coupling factor [Brachyspira hampsonii]ELV04641.1 transcription-repair coupling factor [Brachyspira hampsonii 30599]MBW5380163.1 DeoR/GlpR transcriptional regulator [Brachyspira hampsonii]MBW5408856.1 DeoR/GlpR transcriptional regulator [Brachyspira hampsonii]OEJ18447.1 transcription-repair coupling factor [Brachyspira hampsonii]